LAWGVGRDWGVLRGDVFGAGAFLSSLLGTTAGEPAVVLAKICSTLIALGMGILTHLPGPTSGGPLLTVLLDQGPDGLELLGRTLLALDLEVKK
jgi:hypothetical protein